MLLSNVVAIAIDAVAIAIAVDAIAVNAVAVAVEQSGCYQCSPC